ncbi:hypothetical protein FIV42_04485 [Persicimonas caeni]|uniref:Uncharacterized protein n=1 Tax=Persicimonas caeni TaxID=2292766 RepID=A0A4Y6PP90_PERCE|nr:hypothetical protein [Persicimonas caeni]QDG50023.1 hypothetical protein FIV42_04485 [Persicimonas caeni]QED31244.1 hypothetical protein FRD00_04480 [Persicimonas caeni]
MTSSSRNNRLVLAGLLALAAATVVVVFVMMNADDDEPTAPTPAESQHKPAPLTAWQASDDARTVDVRVDDATGPTLQLEGADPITLTPTLISPRAMSFEWTSWEVHRGQDHTLVVGEGSAGKATLSATWSFFDGNPQAHLALAITALPAAHLADEITLAVSFPSGELALVSTSQADAAVSGPAGVALPATWRGGEQTLTYSNFSGPRVSKDDSTNTLQFELWQKAGSRQDIDWSDCIEAPADLTVDLELDLTVTVGSRATVSRWPLPNAQEAVLVPVFDVASHHPDAQVAQGVAKYADRWLWRARTLLYGHSSPEDPRYGTGGLLGHGLGGTLVVPETFVADEAIQQLAAELEGTHAELAPRSAVVEGYTGSSRLVSSPSCSKLIELSRAGVPAVITGSSNDAALADIGFNTGPPGLTTTVGPVQLDGSRKTLLAQGMSPESLEPIWKSGQTATFVTPFVATRNPLIGAFKEGLLVPERDGHWTVAPEVAGAMTNLELWREETPLLVTSLGAAAGHAERMRGVRWWWSEKGEVELYNPHGEPLHGATFKVWPSETGGSSTTLHLKPGRNSLDVGAPTGEEREGLEPPGPVDWQFAGGQSAD